ncbi:MAG: AmmeMemoRadiSam system protein B, partial [Spirochaetota bacterium]
CLVASSDLTHVGPDYGFEPSASRSDPVAWLRDRNDKAFLDAVLALDPVAALSRAKQDRSACSAGAVAAAMAFADSAGASLTRLLGYATSYEVRQAPSIVGYAALGFYRPA